MITRQRRKWTPSEIDEIRARYHSEYLKDLAERFGVTPVQLTGIAFYYGIKRLRNWKIKKAPPELSRLDLFALIESRDRIGEMILNEPNLERAQRLMQIRKDLNTIINQGL